MSWAWIASVNLVASLVACSGGESVVDSAPPAPTQCEDGTPVVPFSNDETGLQFGDRAADFTSETLDGGTFTLSEAWNGCDSFVVIAYFEGAGGDELWSSDPEDLLANAPKNSQFIFVSEENGPARRAERLQATKDALNLGERRAERVHFLTDRLSAIEGGLGDFVSDYLAYIPDSLVQIDNERAAPAPPPYFIGIDRFQTWDPGGNTNNVVGGTAQIEMAGYLPQFYNHKAELAHRLASEDVTEVTLLDEEVTERQFDRTVELPDLASFDTLEFDVEVTCKERNPFACSEWDRIARIDWCTDSTCEERREIVRWITPYWRRGNRRWAIDASAFLGLVPGGSQTFRISMGPTWERATPRDARVTARFSTRGVPRASSTVRVFTGGNFDDTYNDNHPPVTLDVPAGTSKVELVTILSGHGQANNTNCAEWCDHQHRFSIDGTEATLLAHDGSVGSADGCAPAAAQGVPPGQWGNWAPERAFWCPGLPVDPVATDLTSLVTPGNSAELSYEAFLNDPLTGGGSGGGNISLSAYVVYYE